MIKLVKEVYSDGSEIFYAEPDYSHYDDMKPGGWDGNEICQYGDCHKCKTECMSEAKNAICPKCNSEVYLT
jgi:hypothetical protein